MKTLHLIQSLDPRTGGPPMIAARLAAAQAALGADVTLAAEGGLEDEQGVYAAVPRFGQVQRLTVPPRRNAAALLRRAAPPALHELIADRDAVHLHGVWGGVLLTAARSCRQLGKPYFVLVNGMLDPWSLSQKRWKKRAALALGYRRMLDHAAGLHLGNRHEQSLLAPLGLRARPFIIPNGVFLEELEPLPPRGRFRARHPELGDHPFVLFLSRLHHKKGLDVLVEAFAEVAAADRQVRLVVLGPDDGGRAEFEAAVVQRGLTDRVLAPGPVYGPAKFEALVDAACFCLPSRQEGFSIAILEALACGTPTVISEGCHFPEVGEAGAGVVCPLDARAVAAALRVVLRDPEAAQAMGRRARELVAQRYTWGKVAAATFDMYHTSHPTEVTA